MNRIVSSRRCLAATDGVDEYLRDCGLEQTGGTVTVHKKLQPDIGFQGV